MTQGELDTATRRARNILDQWVTVTGAVDQHSSWYHELQGVIDDAVHCGAQAATGDYRRLDDEEGPVPTKASPYNGDAPLFAELAALRTVLAETERAQRPAVAADAARLALAVPPVNLREVAEALLDQVAAPIPPHSTLQRFEAVLKKYFGGEA